MSYMEIAATILAIAVADSVYAGLLVLTGLLPVQDEYQVRAVAILGFASVSIVAGAVALTMMGIIP